MFKMLGLKNNTLNFLTKMCYFLTEICFFILNQIICRNNLVELKIMRLQPFPHCAMVHWCSIV